LSSLGPDELRRRAAAVRLAVFDVDGVMTDGGLMLGPNGIEYKTFHVHDGLGLVMLRQADIQVAVISSRNSPVVRERMAGLGISLVYQGERDKAVVMDRLCAELGLERDATAYTGDDLIDLPAMGRAGLAIAVANATRPVRERADWITANSGGQGAVREVCDLILDARGMLESCQQRYLES